MVPNLPSAVIRLFLDLWRGFCDKPGQFLYGVVYRPKSKGAGFMCFRMAFFGPLDKRKRPLRDMTGSVSYAFDYFQKFKYALIDLCINFSFDALRNPKDQRRKRQSYINHYEYQRESRMLRECIDRIGNHEGIQRKVEKSNNTIIAKSRQRLADGRLINSVQ